MPIQVTKVDRINLKFVSELLEEEEETHNAARAGSAGSLPLFVSSAGGGPGGGLARANSAIARCASGERSPCPRQASGAPTARTEEIAKTSQETRKCATSLATAGDAHGVAVAI